MSGENNNLRKIAKNRFRAYSPFENRKLQIITLAVLTNVRKLLLMNNTKINFNFVFHTGSCKSRIFDVV